MMSGAIRKRLKEIRSDGVGRAEGNGKKEPAEIKSLSQGRPVSSDANSY